MKIVQIVVGLMLIAFVGCVTVPFAVAADTTASGTQTRGTPSQNAVLKAKPFTLEKASTIVDAEDGGAGFWIEKEGGGTVKSFDTAKSAVGFQLKAGTYYVYPNIKRDRNSATVTLTFR